MNKNIDRDEVVRMYAEKMLSTVQIANAVGLTPGAVRSILVRRNVKMRDGKESHRVRFPQGRNGNIAANWKGGTRRGGSSGCYIMVHSPHHPFCDGDGYVMQHRLVMEQAINRHLTPEEVVHHMNGIKDDNRLENLELLPSKAAHVRRHFSAVQRMHELEAENQRLKERICELVGEA